MPRTLALLVVLAAAGCTRVVREERREQALDTGVEAPFTALGPRTWDFGDGSPRVTGAQVRHAFSRAGTYTVLGFDGDEVADRVRLVVAARSPFRAVPTDARAALVVRTLDELGPAVDFAERLTGPETAQKVLEALPVVAFALEQGSGGGSPVDPAEGLGAFFWSGSGVAVGFVGVGDEAPALAAFEAWLLARGWTRAPGGLLRNAEVQREVEPFVDRGVLYAAVWDEGGREGGVPERVRGSSALGLEADPRLADAVNELPSGGLAFLARPDADTVDGASVVSAALKFSPLEARLWGRLAGTGPLWAAPPRGRARILSAAPEGAALALSVAVPPRRLATLLLGPEKGRRRDRARLEAERHGADLDAALGALDGSLDAVGYFDAEGFLRDTIGAEGRPQPRGTLLAEAGVTSAPPLAALIDAGFAALGLPALRAREKSLRLWRTAWAGQPVDVALTDEAVFLKGGTPLEGRPTADLRAALMARFDGAFGEGHASFFADVGQLRRDLMVPRQIAGLDARKVVTAQAVTLTFLDRLTRVDQVLLDLAPDERGARVQAWVRLTPKQDE